MPIIERQWLSQRNNTYRPLGTCFNTSLADMLLPFIDPFIDLSIYEGKQVEDYIFELCNSQLGIDIVNRLIQEDANNKWMLSYINSKSLNEVWEIEKAIGNAIQNQVKLTWIENGNRQLIENYINMGSPVLIQLAFGHIILVIGYDANNYIVNDSYGDFKTGYANQNGASVIYQKNWLEKQLSGNPIRLMYYEKI